MSPTPAARRLHERLLDRSLPKPEWTHEAHLIACWVDLDEHDGDVDATVDSLRDVIRSYNEATGVANTPTSGYHETLTRYYVEAVAAVGATSAEELLADQRCSRDAPLRLWSKERLFSPEARAMYVPPDLRENPGQVSEVTTRPRARRYRRSPDPGSVREPEHSSPLVNYRIPGSGDRR